MEEQLYNPWDGKPESKWDRIAREHTEAWAPVIADKMNSATTWSEVKELYDEHNAIIALLKIEYEALV